MVQTTRALHRAKVIKLPSPCFLSSVMKKCRNKTREGRPYLAMTKVIGGDRDESDGFPENVILSLALVFFCYGLSFPLVFFLFPCFLLPFSFGLSPAFFSVSPLLHFSRLQSFVFIGDVHGLLFAHDLPLDKHGWEGCVGVSLGFEYLSSILIYPGHLSL